MYEQYKRSMSTDNLDLAESIKQVLSDGLTDGSATGGGDLSTDDIQELLDDAHSDEACRQGIIGYPSRPLYREIASQIQVWIDNKECPVLDLPNYDLLDEKGYSDERAIKIHEIDELLAGFTSLWGIWSPDERSFRIREIIEKLGKRGLLDLLGIRKTVGTQEFWPPPRKVIEDTFQAMHKPGSPSVLTVGARALAKHCHRDESTSWWGASKGTEADKNAHATELLDKVLNNATWINIHQLPHDVVIIEARQENGYGARWTKDGQQFRGFLEPQMVDGHVVGWKH